MFEVVCFRDEVLGVLDFWELLLGILLVCGVFGVCLFFWGEVLLLELWDEKKGGVGMLGMNLDGIDIEGRVLESFFSIVFLLIEDVCLCFDDWFLMVIDMEDYFFGLVMWNCLGFVCYGVGICLIGGCCWGGVWEFVGFVVFVIWVIGLDEWFGGGGGSLLWFEVLFSEVIFGFWLFLIFLKMLFFDIWLKVVIFFVVGVFGDVKSVVSGLIVGCMSDWVLVWLFLKLLLFFVLFEEEEVGFLFCLCVGGGGNFVMIGGRVIWVIFVFKDVEIGGVVVMVVIVWVENVVGDVLV